MHDRQHTIRKAVSFSGIGLHTGNQVNLTLKPAPPNSGVLFKRMDLEDQPVLEARIENVVETTRGTTLGKGNAKVHTVEHILSAAAGLGVDNLLCEIDANEPPIADGSARQFVKMLHEAGLEPQDAPRQPLILKEPFFFSQDGTTMIALPADRLSVSCTCSDDRGRLIQYLRLNIDRESFESQVSPARTFCFYEEIEWLFNKGLIKGGSLENAVVIREDAILSKEALRFKDEFVRHKILDIVGDLYLLGRPLVAHVIAIRPGHSSNVELAQVIAAKLKTTPSPQSTTVPLLPTPPTECALDIRRVLEVLPHRFPFLLVDRILKIDTESEKVVGLKNVTMNEPFFQGHFPKMPIMPGVLQVEAMAQVASILLLYKGDNAGKLGLFLSIDKVKFRRPVVPGDQLVIEVEMLKSRGNICRAKGQVKVGDEIASEAEMMFSVLDERVV
jgi:UDP-3-O-[3-hydroxymyristoyl] N-acetylglucosamine deacetylase/3-hydroxyacyl-[acyl-carrier-protein] dehydratase